MNRVWLVLVLASVGCAERQARVGRELFGSSSFAISNSPMLVRQREPRVKNGRVTVTYSFLIESFADYPQSVALAGARARIAEHPASVRCKVGDQVLDELLLEARGRYRVDCDLAFELAEIPLDKLGDVTARITIPMTLGGEPRETTFSYFFRSEDAS
ncbi:MAG TPA: hypothetical protein VER96_34140 [Polyangiaceae bacterium]|nr:hypothetical protein [Polyangiaceae bacterium]